MKHLKHILVTCVYSHCNICNIQIYFCNVQMKLLKHTSETLETYAYNMRFQRNMYLLLGRVEACRHTKLDAGVELDAAEVAGGEGGR